MTSSDLHANLGFACIWLCSCLGGYRRYGPFPASLRMGVAGLRLLSKLIFHAPMHQPHQEQPLVQQLDFST